MMMAVEDIATAPPITTATAGARIEERDGDGGHDAGGHQHLRAADPEDFPAHGHQSRQGKFQPQRKYQEYHAEIRQQLGRLVVGRHAERMRSQQHADDEIAQDRGQGQFAHARDHADGCGQQDQNLQQRIVMHSFLVAYRR